MKFKILYLLVFIIIIAGIIITTNNRKPDMSESVNSGRLQVVASFYPLYFFATQIGADKTDIDVITPAGAEAHEYEPSTRQIAKISKSDMLILNGGKLEPWGDKIKDILTENKVLVVYAGSGLLGKGVEENGNKILDPHIWLDPALAKREAENIEKGFEQIDPGNKTYYESNLRILGGKLDQLDSDYKNGLTNCRTKKFITGHEAFGYLASRYGLNQIAISGISSYEEPTPQQFAEITNLVKKENIKVIFFESFVDPKLSQTIANETGSKTMVLDPLEGISPQNMSEGHNYFTVMRENLNNLRIAMECK